MTKQSIVDILNKTIEWSLYLLIFCLPFSKSIIEITITIALVAWVIKKILLRDFRLKKTPLNILLFALFFASVISMINAGDKFFVAYALITKCSKWILLYFIIVEEMNSETKLKNLLTMIFLSGIVVCIDAFIQYRYLYTDVIRHYPSFKYTPAYSSDGFYRGFPTGPFPFPNDFSAWMLMILIPALVIFLFGIRSLFAKIGVGLFSALLAYFFYFANTRSAWLGFMLSMCAILAIKKIRLLMAVLLLILVAYPFLPKEKTKDIFCTASFTDRGVMWKNGYEIFMQHPIIGNGLNTFFGKYKEVRDDECKGLRGSYAHNGFLQIAADIGILGLTVFLLIIGQTFYCSYKFIKKCNDRFYKALSLGICGGLLAFLVHSFFDTNLHSLPLVALFWFTVGVLMSLDQIACKNEA
ncbi:MAG: O-antigen ligase family protein [Candidatus Omnitrophica bacterium]|nr:O-antigen ligase family protein [Candidatus Omnitrophota bacterium]